MDFKDVIGHENLISNLQRAIKNNSIAHGYLFSGPDGIGKKKVAMIFAKTLLCEAREINPCNKCSSCIQIDSGNHPDLITQSPEGKSFKKEQVINIINNINVKPYVGDRKIFILEHIDKMTDHAQNSLLKTLEEPPYYAIIIMTATNSKSILPTVLSRSQLLRFSPINNNEIKSTIVNKYGKTNEEATFISSICNGIIGKAIKICESDEFKETRESINNIIEALLSEEKFKIYSHTKFFNDNKDNINDILDIMYIWFRDILIYKESDDDELIINKDKLAVLSNQSIKISKRKLYKILEDIKITMNNINSNVNYELSIEILLLSIQEV